MKKTYEIQYRLKLTDFELRVMVNALNAYRLKQKEAGKDTTYLCNMILSGIQNGGNMRTVGLHGTLSLSPFVEENESGNAVRAVGVRIYEPKILGKTDRRSMPDGYSFYVDITGRAGAGSQYNSEISE